ncbi:MAG: TIR domain-containing protein [Anaerolineales bacterium]|nr:TIR domain-containing protein [Anaerolineales bacterium]
MARNEAYLKAEKKIEEALKSGATELNLHGNTDLKLTELPDSLWQLTQLYTLNLSYNQLTTLPESLGQLTQLQTLDLSGNKLISLPDSLVNLTILKKLEFLNPGFESLPIQICKLRELEILILGTGRYFNNIHMTTGRGTLNHLPVELGDLSSLEVLLLGNNQITEIPSSLLQLENLKILDLENNPLNPELAAVYWHGLAAIKAYLRAKATARKLKVFLCHASQDKPAVYDLYKKLLAEGWIEPWLDAKKLLLGQDWQSEIKNAVETADNVIIFLSHTSINKDGFIQKELRLAKDIALEKSEGSVFLIPLRLDECEVPRSLQSYQWGNFFGEEQEQTYSNLLESLKLRLEDIKRKEVFTK